MKLCPNCKIVVKNYGKHIRRNRCEAQHIRLSDKPPKGQRNYGKE